MGAPRSTDSRHYDVAIIGGGAVGSVCAIAYARKGTRVALFEANPGASTGLKGEWLHPPALQVLEKLGIHFDTDTYGTKGFVVFPEDGSPPIPLNYPDGLYGLAYPHDRLVMRLRETAIQESNVDFIPQRVRLSENGRIDFTEDGVAKSVTADQVVDAAGRGSVLLRLLGMTERPTIISRMVGVKMDGAALPMEGYGHIYCGGPGPIFMYRLGDETVSAIMDVPREYTGDQATDLLLNEYAPWLPEEIRPMFVEAVQRGGMLAGNTARPRISYGNSRFVAIGDAAGHYHPMTAVGLTLGFGDAMTLTESKDFDAFVARRFREVRSPEMLALGLYEVLADHRDEMLALRHAVYWLWRKRGRISDLSIHLLACEDTREASLGFVGAIVVAMAVVRTIPLSLRPREWRQSASTVWHLASRIGWFIRAVHQLRRSRARGDVQNEKIHYSLAHAFLLPVPALKNRSRQSSR